MCHQRRRKPLVNYIYQHLGTPPSAGVISDFAKTAQKKWQRHCLVRATFSSLSILKQMLSQKCNMY